MTKQEFETRTKMVVTEEEFTSINEIYMEVYMDKDEFCKEYKKHGNSLLVADLKDRLFSHRNELVIYSEKMASLNQQLVEAGEIIARQAVATESTDLRDKAVQLMGGMRKYLSWKLNMGLSLWSDELEAIKNILAD